MKHNMVKTLTPIKTNYVDNDFYFNIWNRTYKTGSDPIFSSIVSDGQELLSSPIRLVSEIGGKEFIFDGFKTSPLNDVTDESAVCLQYTNKNATLINTAIKTEYDGMVDCTITLTSQGRTVAQVFGLEQSDLSDRVISKLWLEIPLKKEVAKFYHYAEQCRIEIDGVKTDSPTCIYQAGKMAKKSIKMPFRPQVYVGNDDVGLSVMFESDKNWQVADDSNAMEFIVNDNDVVLRLHLLDEKPFLWKDKSGSQLEDLTPFSFRLMLMATPVKPLSDNIYTERPLHIDCFKKILVDYEDFLFNPFEDTGEIAFDRIKRLGVNTLYIHEKWNDIQNSPILTKKAADRLKLIVKEGHKRGIKVIPYFGYEFSTLSPLFGEYAKEFLYSDVNWFWYRVPYQRALKVCYNSNYKEIFVKGLIKLCDEFGFDGLYLDSIFTTTPCINTEHGCGYMGFDGKIHPTYPIFAVRDLFKTLYLELQKRGKTLNNHSYGNFPTCVLPYVTSLWEGESLQALFMKGELKDLPEDYYRALYTGKSIGVPVYMLCYSNPPVWTYTQAVSNALLFGALPKPVDTGAPLEETSVLWKVLKDFKAKKAKFVPYFKGNITTSDQTIKVSYYDNKKSNLLIVANTKNSPSGKVSVYLPNAVKKLVNAITGEILGENTNTFSVEFDKFDYSIVKVVK